MLPLAQSQLKAFEDKMNNVWLHYSLTLKATTIMPIGCECLGDDGTGD